MDLSTRRSIVEEYHSVPACPLLDGWEVADDAWAADIGGIPCPDWTMVFSFTAAGEFLHPSFAFWVHVRCCWHFAQS
jgi:hypothetical protein